MRTNDDKLRHCPTCGGPVDDLHLRDYSKWLFDVLPGKAGASDLDCVLERGGCFLGIEFKSEKWVPPGQRIMFNALIRSGWDIYIVVDTEEPDLLVCKWNLDYLSWHATHTDQLKEIVREWWDDKTEHPCNP